MCGRHWRWVIATVVLGASLLPVVQTMAAVDLYSPVLPGLRERVTEQTEANVSRYELDVRLDPEASTIGGRERIRFVNRYSAALSDVAFRLYPNAFYYGEGQTTIEDVRVAGKAAEARLEVEETVLRIPLPETLAPGDAVNLSFRFQTVIPTDSEGTFGIFSHETRFQTWVLADWYPIVAGYEPGSGWWLDAPTEDGDPTFSDAALYDVTISAPTGLPLVGTGRAIEATRRGEETVSRFVSGPAREFTLVADGDFQKESLVVDGTTINLFVNGDADASAAQDGRRVTLETTAAALEAFSERFGPYPYDELDLVEVDLGSGVLAVSWSGVIFLEGPSFLRGDLSATAAQSLAFTIAHEVGHQWWGAMVGVNSNDHTFMNEGLTNAVTALFVDDEPGGSGSGQVRAQIVDRYLAALTQSGDGIVDLPLTAPREGPSRGALDYGKAAIGFLAIRQEIGAEAFLRGLAAYANDFGFGVATPDDLRHAFERASGEELQALWRFWFNAAETTSEDVEAVFPE